MSDYLKRYSRPLDGHHLVQVLTGGAWPDEPLRTPISAEAVRLAVEGIDPELSGSAIDVALVEPFHRSLAALTKREAADMRLWHYLAAGAFPEVVWRRWNRGDVPGPQDVASTLTAAMTKRFLGKASLNGVSRNTFARLWWTAEELREGDDYSLPRLALRNQDTFQAVFERFFGIYPEAARACLRRFDGVPEIDRRRAAKWLQQCLSTTVLERLSEEEVSQILEEALPSA